MFPVPGPISRTVSVGLIPAFATMAVTTAGFLRKCCPSDVFGATRLFDADADLLLLLDDEAVPPLLAGVWLFREERE